MVGSRKLNLTLIFYILILPALALAQSPRFFSRITPRAGSLSDNYIFSLTLENSDSNSKPTLSSSPDFEVNYVGPQSSISILNGSVSRSMSWTYSLKPLRPGDLQTPAAEINIGSTTLHAESLRIRVSTSPPTPRPSQDIEGASLTQSVDPKSVFVGQQLVHSLFLNTAINLFEPQAPDFTYDGFVTKQIADNERSSTIIGGTQYDVLRFRRALYPLKEGEISISPRVLKAKVRQNSGGRQFPFENFNPFDMDVFDSLIGARKLKDIQLTSNGLSVTVNPLPKAPDGLNDWGLTYPVVGETTIEASASDGNLKVGDTKTVTIKITSTGNLNGIKSVQHKIISSVQVYEEAPESKEFESGGQLVSQKTFKISVVPTAGGKLEIPAFHLGYFDPDEETYKTASSKAFVFEVEGEAPMPHRSGVAPETSAAAPPTSVAEKYVEETWLDRLSQSISLSLAIFALAVIIFIILVLWVLSKISAQGSNKRIVSQQLSSAADFAQLSKFLCEAIEKYFLVDSSARGAALREGLRRASLSEQDTFYLVNLLDEMDLAAYSGDPSKATSSFDELKRRALEFKSWPN